MSSWHPSDDGLAGTVEAKTRCHVTPVSTGLGFETLPLVPDVAQWERVVAHSETCWADGGAGSPGAQRHQQPTAWKLGFCREQAPRQPKGEGVRLLTC